MEYPILIASFVLANVVHSTVMSFCELDQSCRTQILTSELLVGRTSIVECTARIDFHRHSGTAYRYCSHIERSAVERSSRWVQKDGFVG